MAPGKGHVNSRTSKKFLQGSMKSSSGVKKSNTSKMCKKKLKARTLLEIEEINKTFTSIHSELVTDQSQTEEPKVLNAKKEKKVEIAEKRATSISGADVTQEDLTETLKNIANLMSS
ncbi:uncharacterized protein LOC114964004 [Acropora millepora]|uniref:uncharacterized protein LOC114964004 n=1 Tax=Acropora millepora TaxID=45264 RepID=UPI001CF45AEE|nr:uncharacterized protein LOC114964004 [Acropora millepora]